MTLGTSLLLGLVALVASVFLGVAGFVLMGHARYVSRRTAAFSGGALLRYWLLEALAIFALFGFALAGLGRNRLSGPENTRPVLCVHGFIGNGTNWWGLRRRLLAAGRASAAVSLGRPPRPIEAYLPTLVQALLDLSAQSPDGRVDVVAHSMGGLVLRLAARDYPEAAAVLGRVVTLGSPHAGTQSMPRYVRDELEQMRPGSTFLLQLGEGMPGEAWTTIAARQDYVVFPEESSQLAGAVHEVLDDTGHAGLLVHRDCHEAVCRALSAGSVDDRV